MAGVLDLAQWQYAIIPRRKEAVRAATFSKFSGRSVRTTYFDAQASKRSYIAERFQSFTLSVRILPLATLPL